MKTLPTMSEIKQHLDYDKHTGLFTWKKSPSPSVKAGSIAGSTAPNGYVYIRLNKTKYEAHRLAYIYEYGTIPEKTIDHINRIKNDNRIINLRPMSHLDQHKNKGLGSNNKSGFSGVSFVKSRNRWRSRIKVNGKDIHLGFHKTKESAVEARLKAEKEYGFNINLSLI